MMAWQVTSSSKKRQGMVTFGWNPAIFEEKSLKRPKYEFIVVSLQPSKEVPSAYKNARN
ncbi:MAG: hypothetical protein IJ712_06770 [Anaerovibrio sp.]|nr:hypothetical protein [Anaerovibrio sp.]